MPTPVFGEFADVGLDRGHVNLVAVTELRNFRRSRRAAGVEIDADLLDIDLPPEIEPAGRLFLEGAEEKSTMGMPPGECDCISTGGHRGIQGIDLQDDI